MYDAHLFVAYRNASDLVEYTVSADGGVTWQNRGTITRHDSSAVDNMVGNPTSPIRDHFAARGDPSVSVDPRAGHQGDVYVAFVAADMESSSNSDEFVSRSLHGGHAGPDNFDALNTIRIPDSVLHVPGETREPSQESMPAIVIDSLGGVNLLFARTDSDPGPTATASIRYARWASFDALQSHPEQRYLSNLAGPFTTSGAVSIGLIGNDYQDITAGGCYVWCAYTAPTGTTNHIGIYVARFSATCTETDVDSSGATDSADVFAFASAYSTGLSQADVNKDGQLNAIDVVDFVSAYTEATGQHP